MGQNVFGCKGRTPAVIISYFILFLRTSNQIHYTATHVTLHSTNLTMQSYIDVINREKQALTSCFPSPDWSSVVVLPKHSVTIWCHCLLLRCLCLNSVTIEARPGIYSRGNRYTDGKQRLSISETPLQYKQI